MKMKVRFFGAKDTASNLENVDDEYKRAVIGYLIMSVVKPLGKDKLVRLDDLFGLTEEALKDMDEEEKGEREETRDDIISACEKLLEASGDSADERYDAVLEEIDTLIEECGDMEGDVKAFWSLLNLVIDDADYPGSKKRLLKHIARKLEIEKTVLPELEKAHAELKKIEAERTAIEESDKPYKIAKAELAALDDKAKEIAKTLSGIGFTGAAAAAATGSTLDDDEVDFEADDGDEDSEYGLGEQITDGICDCIRGVTDIVCAPLEWLTNKLM